MIIIRTAGCGNCSLLFKKSLPKRKFEINSEKILGSIQIHYYYAIAYWLGCTFFIWHNPKRITGWKLGVTHVLFFAAIAVFMVVTDGVPREWFLPCVSFYVFLILMFIKTCCDINWAKAGYFSG